METKRAEYINKQSLELVRLSRKRKHLHDRMHKELSEKQFQSVCTELDHTMMEISKTCERIGYVLGHLTLFELVEEYKPNGWQTYQGIKDEMRNLKFEY
jgi:hypothetical protein